MEQDFEKRLAELTAEYEAKLRDLTQAKDSEREQLRAELQLRIDELLRQIEDEKQNMGAAGKRREEELLGQIAALEATVKERDRSIQDYEG